MKKPWDVIRKKQLTTALADAIRRPMGVVPDSALQKKNTLLKDRLNLLEKKNKELLDLSLQHLGRICELEQRANIDNQQKPQ